jgi:cell division protein FtsN
MASNGAPRWVWIFTPLVALSFAGFLLYLTSVPAGDDIDKITESLTEKAAQAKNDLTNSAKSAANKALQDALKGELPEAAKTDTVNKAVDNYEFFEILENKEVEVQEVKEYKSTPKGTDKDGNKIQYRLKTGSFRGMEGADRQKAQLLLNGLSAQIEPATINGNAWYRVFTGPFVNRSQMNKAQDQLADMGIQAVEIKQSLP